MKTSKTFRLSEKAIQILKQQGNETQYIEDLILTTPQKISYGESLILEKLDGLSSNGRTEAFEASNTGSSPVEPARNKSDIVAQITRAEAQRDEELAGSQDPEYSQEISDKYGKIISELWEEFHDREA